MSEPRRERRRTVLVVDDDPWLTKLISDVLTEENYAVTVAQDGIDALRAVDDEVPDVILLDLTMPRMNGEEVFRRLREMGVHTPVVIVSAQRDARLVAQAAAGLLLKPFDIDQLVALVENVVRPDPPFEHAA